MTIDKVPERIIKKNILIVDDHPFIIEGYKNAITRYKPKEYDFLITQAKDCKSGYEIIIDPATASFDIAFLDISMPAYEEKEIYSGEDLAKLIMEHMPNCKIILLTMYTELLKIKTIIRTIKPKGLVIKNDLTFDELLFAFDKVMKNSTYYSQSVIEMLEESPKDSIEIDQLDEQILFHLSKGTKTDEIPHYIPISLKATIRRIDNLKGLLNVNEGTVEDLVSQARNKRLL